MVLTKHHKFKRAVWGRDKKKNRKSIWLCKDCHVKLEAEITKRENEVLQQHIEIYIEPLNELLRGEAGAFGSEEKDYGEAAAIRKKIRKGNRRTGEEKNQICLIAGLAMLD